MAKVAYSLAGAAKAVSVDKSTIVDAIRSGELQARVVNERPLVLHCDIQAWAKSLPFFRTIR